MMIEVKVSFDHDRDAAMAATQFWGALALTPEQKAGVEDPVEMQRLADELPVERTASRFIVSTDPDEHVEPDQALPRPRLHPPGVPRPGPGPGALPAALRRGDPAPAAGSSGVTGMRPGETG